MAVHVADSLRQKTTVIIVTLDLLLLVFLVDFAYFSVVRGRVEYEVAGEVCQQSSRAPMAYATHKM